MALLLHRALGSRALMSQLPGIKSSLFGARCVTMKAAPVQKALMENHDERNMRIGRPQSPHLTIYQFQLTSVLSISHRMTGCMLTGYATILGIGALVSPHDFSYYVSMIESLKLSVPTLVTLKFIIAYPAVYHTVNGIRHLTWDMAKFLTIKDVYTTGYAMLASSIILTGILALL